VRDNLHVTDHNHVAGEPLPAITDQTMRELIGRTQPYTAMLLLETAGFTRPEVDPIVWEHGRRMMALAEHGILAILLPDDNDPTDWSGLGIFAASADEVRAIMDHDPGVEAGIFTYEIHPVRGFPESHFPA
jgi:hypothetical protein